ncbi:hypothetical protein [Streptomyces sp. NRRL F-5755]|uniref:hypothetical protein n=1 Tax=Streptomyces sp. NRRL F-5755 TaxID=1519475 RepID=UPI000AA9B7D8|nr:hypothetical protein [Streptomyces sp. NRRL F-5755]
MGKASKKKQKQRARTAPPAASAAPVEVMDDGDPQALGEAALNRLLRLNVPGKVSLAGAYALGYGALGYAQQEGTDPHWYQEIDPLDALFLGTVWPQEFSDELQFANARDAWLRLIRGTVHEKGVRCFVREALSASKELGRPVDDGKLMLALTGRLEAAGLDQRRLPRRLLPEIALQACRAVVGPSPELQLPDPPAGAKEQVRRFREETDEGWPADGTPQDVLSDGLCRFRDAGWPVEEESVMLLPALYAALMAKPGEPLENLVPHACAWALSVDEASALIPVLDVLLVAPQLGMTVADTLGRLFAVPAFTEPIPSDALLWTSSPGLALPRLAFEMGVPEVTTLENVITPDMLDWAGKHARMRLSAAAHADDTNPEETDSTDGTADSQGKPEEQWADRREVVRKAVLRKVRKKSGGSSAMHRSSDHPVERIWDADGSSVIRYSADTARGQALHESLESQLEAFREKFGREPEPGEPLFFDPDADEPTQLTRDYFDDLLLDMAERAADMGIDPAFLHAWRELGYVVTEENRSMFTTAEVLTYGRAVARHRQAGK